MYGEEGMKIFNNEFMENMGHMFVDPRTAVCLLIAFGLLLILLLLFPILVAVRADGHHTWNWFAVFAPVFIGDVLVLIITFLAWCVKDESTGDRTCSIVGAIHAMCVVVFTILLCCGLQELISHWVIVFCPLLLVELISDAHLPFKLRRSVFEKQVAAQKEMQAEMEAQCGLTPTESEEKYSHYVIGLLFRAAWRFILLVLLILKLDGHIDVGWGVVFLPIWLLLAVGFGSGIFSAWRTAQNVCPDLCCVGCFFGIMVGVVFAFFLMLCLRLDGHSLSLGVVFIPVFLALGVLTCCVCICGPFTLLHQSSGMMPQQDEDSSEGYAGGEPHATFLYQTQAMAAGEGAPATKGPDTATSAHADHTTMDID
eukprot:NODE_648_length_1470_cov_63.772695_g483_i0.p1 GENE.NODE_648_length_1470_cov_63.772695_g483_i0~~NODE_648_length_1470_cov_63.772695_g483_i0.p1  ORF type:complete len:368 (-),score=66.73 NODE_648_length_1470_cov_63.772695_g483_i0:78-1181(-)